MLKASFTWVIARSVSASFCLRLRCFPSGHTNCQQTRDHALPPSPGWLQRRPPLRFLPSPYATCKRKYDKSLLCLIPNNGWSPVFRMRRQGPLTQQRPQTGASRFASRALRSPSPATPLCPTPGMLLPPPEPRVSPRPVQPQAPRTLLASSGWTSAVGSLCLP